MLGTHRPFDTLPHAFFDAMALMVAASLLLAIATDARTIWLRARPTEATKPGRCRLLFFSCHKLVRSVFFIGES